MVLYSSLTGLPLKRQLLQTRSFHRFFPGYEISGCYSHAYCSKHWDWTILAGLKTLLTTVMISPTIWLPLQHKSPNINTHTHERSDVFKKCQIYCSSTEDAQQPTPAFSQLALVRTMPRANFGWIILGSHKPCADCAHMAMELSARVVLFC